MDYRYTLQDNRLSNDNDQKRLYHSQSSRFSLQFNQQQPLKVISPNKNFRKIQDYHTLTFNLRFLLSYHKNESTWFDILINTIFQQEHQEDHQEGEHQEEKHQAEHQSKQEDEQVLSQGEQYSIQHEQTKKQVHNTKPKNTQKPKIPQLRAKFHKWIPMYSVMNWLNKEISQHLQQGYLSEQTLWISLIDQSQNYVHINLGSNLSEIAKKPYFNGNIEVLSYHAFG